MGMSDQLGVRANTAFPLRATDRILEEHIPSDHQGLRSPCDIINHASLAVSRAVDALHGSVPEGELLSSFQQHFRISDRFDRVWNMEIVNLLVDSSPILQPAGSNNTTASNLPRQDIPSNLPEASVGVRS